MFNFKSAVSFYFTKFVTKKNEWQNPLKYNKKDKTTFKIPMLWVFQNHTFNMLSSDFCKQLICPRKHDWDILICLNPMICLSQAAHILQSCHKQRRVRHLQKKTLVWVCSNRMMCSSSQLPTRGLRIYQKPMMCKNVVVSPSGVITYAYPDIKLFAPSPSRLQLSITIIYPRKWHIVGFALSRKTRLRALWCPLQNLFRAFGGTRQKRFA